MGNYFDGLVSFLEL